MNDKVAIIVEPYSTGRMFAPKMNELGYSCYALKEDKSLHPELVQSFDAEPFLGVFGDVGTLKAYFEDNAIRPSAVVTGSEVGVARADQLSAYYGTLGNKPESSLRRRDKDAMQEALREEGLRSIKTVKVTNAEEISPALDKVGTDKVVIKPNNAAGTEGVSIVDKDQVDAGFIATIEWGKTNCVGDVIDSYLVQEFIDGVEYAIDMVAFGYEYVISSIAVYEKVEINDAKCVYKGLQLLDPQDARLTPIVSYAKKCALALDIGYGPIHMEVMVDAAGPVMIEAASRLHGGIAPMLIEDCFDVGLVDLSIMSLTGKQLLKPPSMTKSGEIAFAISERNGVYKGMSDQDINHVASLRSCAGYDILIPVNGAFIPTKNFLDCPAIGWFASESKDDIVSDKSRFREVLSKYF